MKCTKSFILWSRIKWKHFPRYWPFVRGIHRSPVNSPHKGQWRWALMFSLICSWINGWVKKSWGWWLQTPSRSLWRHCNGNVDISVAHTDCVLFCFVAIQSDPISTISCKVTSWLLWQSYEYHSAVFWRIWVDILHESTRTDCNGVAMITPRWIFIFIIILSTWESETL